MPGDRIHKDNINFDALKKINSDIIGWIDIPDTEIDYPIMQARDNEYYLHHGYDHKYHPYGAVFMDAHNRGFQDIHTMIYAHNVPTGGMFHDLELFKNEKFYDDHSTYQIFTPEHTYEMQILSFYQTDANSDTYHMMNHQGDISKYIQMVLDLSWYSRKDKTMSNDYDHIITLSTCSYENNEGADTMLRYVLHAGFKEIP